MMHSNSTRSRSNVAFRVLKFRAIFVLSTLSACGPSDVVPQAVKAARPIPLESAEANQPEPRAVASPEPSSAAPIWAPRVVTWSALGIAFEGVTFDARSHRLRVVDQAGGPGSEFASALQAARSKQGIVAVNAGFFTPEGEPLGLVVSRGRARGHWNSATSLGSGLWYENEREISSIARRETLGYSTARLMPELLQSGPMLVESGRIVKGLHGGQPRPRTFIAWDGENRWWIGCAAPSSLHEMAAALVNSTGAGFQIRDALNLDGGRSSELWVGSSVSGGPLTRRPLFNRKVRNYLVLVSR